MDDIKENAEGETIAQLRKKLNEQEARIIVLEEQIAKVNKMPSFISRSTFVTGSVDK